MKRNSGPELVCFLPYKLNDAEPRHHNFHLSLDKLSKKVTYLCLKEQDRISSQQLNILPATLLRDVPYVSILSLIAIRKNLSSLPRDSIFYFYEGNLSWLPQLVIFNTMLSFKFRMVMNIFPTSLLLCKHKYLFKLDFLFELLRKVLTFTRIVLTVDNARDEAIKVTSLKNTPEFPLFSSISLRTPKLNELKVSKHRNVLVFIRNVESNLVRELLSDSCRDCTFNFMDHPNSNFLNEANTSTFARFVAREEYENYFAQYDYAVFLYSLNGNSSGKILDFSQLRIPVCIPSSETYLSKISLYCRAYRFDFENRESILRCFNHPIFEPALEEPFFGPEEFYRRINEVYENAANSRPRIYSKSAVFLVFLLTIFAQGFQLSFSFMKLLIAKIRLTGRAVISHEETAH